MRNDNKVAMSVAGSLLASKHVEVSNSVINNKSSDKEHSYYLSDPDLQRSQSHSKFRPKRDSKRSEQPIIGRSAQALVGEFQPPAVMKSNDFTPISSFNSKV